MIGRGQHHGSTETYHYCQRIRRSDRLGSRRSSWARSREFARARWCSRCGVRHRCCLAFDAGVSCSGPSRIFGATRIEFIVRWAECDDAYRAARGCWQFHLDPAVIPQDRLPGLRQRRQTSLRHVMHDLESPRAYRQGRSQPGRFHALLRLRSPATRPRYLPQVRSSQQRPTRRGRWGQRRLHLRLP